MNDEGEAREERIAASFEYYTSDLFQIHQNVVITTTQESLHIKDAAHSGGINLNGTLLPRIMFLWGKYTRNFYQPSNITLTKWLKYLARINSNAGKPYLSKLNVSDEY